MSVRATTSMSLSEIVAKIIDTVTSCTIILMENAAQLPLGQTIFRFVDRFLWIIEKSAQWSLPAHEITAEENGKSFGKLELVRPLPWIFFLPVLIILRMLRVGLNVGLFILGYSKVEPAEMVKFLQKNRRRLRSIKSTGVKNMRHRSVKDNDFHTSETKRRAAQLIRTIQTTLSSLSCLDNSKMSPSPPPTRIKVHNHESTPTPEEQSTTESAMSLNYGDSKRKYSELSSEDHLSEDSEEETIQAKIDRLAAINDSVEDPDYLSPGMSSPEDDSQSISGGSNISENEIEDLKEGIGLWLAPNLEVKQATKESLEPCTRVSASKSTGVEGNIVNSSIANASGNCEDFYSPRKLGEEVETEFYSPISSTSPSPDRLVSNSKQGQPDWPVENTIQTTDHCQNGEQEANMVSQIPGPNRKRTNGRSDKIRNVGAIQTNDGPRASTNTSGKGSHAGKRGARGATHASRKKK